MIMGIDHGYYAIKTRHFSFPAGVTAYTHEPYTLKNTLQIGGKYYVCGTGRQPILRDKTVNDNYCILTLAAIAMELRCRGLPAESSVTLAAGLPLARYGRDKKLFTEYLLRNGQPVSFLFEGERYKVKIENVKLFPQGYSAIAIHPELVKDEPSVLLMDIGGWTVDLMRLDNNVPNAATCRSLELGMIRCMDEIQEQVRRDTGLSVTDAQVERILAGKPCSMDPEARKLIQRQGRLYTERLISAAMEAGFDLRTLPVILMGGGAATVMRNVSERDGLCRAFLLEDDKVNAEGYERILSQFTCSLLALGAAVGLYFIFDLLVGTEDVGWICILGAAPFAVCGFFTYHGMTAEQTLWAWFKSQVLTPRRLVFRSDSLYYQALQPAIEQGKKPPRKKKKRKAKEPAGEKAPAPKPEKEDAYH